jgi:DNA-directed RNA polymerase specialized sigma24 family protein
LPVTMREVLVLRELEGLSYREIAEVADIPLGTVMSSLSRARAGIRMLLIHHPNKPSSRRLVPVGPNEQHQGSVASGG